jgi:NmrA-like family
MILAFKSTGAVKMSKPRILVTGATGKTGLPTALGLLEKGFPVRALVKTVDARAERLRAAGAEITCGSLENFRDLETSMQGVARAYFCPPLAPGTLRRATLFATAASEARLEAVVQLSQWVADGMHPAVHAREKWLTNQVLSWAPNVGVITVRPGWFADNYFAVIGQAAQFGMLAFRSGRASTRRHRMRTLPASSWLASPIPRRMSEKPIGRRGRGCLHRPRSPPRWGRPWAGGCNITTCRFRCFSRRRTRLGSPNSSSRSSTGSCRTTSPTPSASVRRRTQSSTSRVSRPRIFTRSPDAMCGVPRTQSAGLPAPCARPPDCWPRSSHAGPDISGVEARLGAPWMESYRLARESSGWLAAHA